jgi:hypothetical protein
MSELLERLEDPRVKQVLNQNIWDEFRYLIILYACTRLQPFNGNAESFDGFHGILKSTMREFAQNEKVSRFAFPPKLEFEFFKGANKILEQRLENELGYVKTFRKSNFTYYALTPQGVQSAESALTEAVKNAEKQRGTSQTSNELLQTMPLPQAILDKIRKDLQDRVNSKQINENTMKELEKEYEELEAVTFTPAATAAEPIKIRLSQQTVTIGRDLGCDKSFPNDRFMSRRHAAIEWSKGQYLMSDLHSKNGTYRIEDSRRISIHNEKVRLDQIYQLGTTRMIFTT